MKLYYFPIAPNPTKVRSYLVEKGLELPTELVNLPKGEQRAPGFLEKNPLGKLPVLELDDGTYLNESLPIIEYLEELHPDPPMIGMTPEERARTRALERLADLGSLQNSAILVHMTNSPLGIPPNEHVANWARLNRKTALEVLDAKIGAGPFVAGDRVTIADCTLFAGLAFGERFGVTVDPALENLTRWRSRFSERPSANLPF